MAKQITNLQNADMRTKQRQHSRRIQNIVFARGGAHLPITHALLPARDRNNFLGQGFFWGRGFFWGGRFLGAVEFLLPNLSMVLN